MDHKVNSKLSNNPLLTIWTKPRETIRTITENDPTKFVLILAALAGIVEMLDKASAKNLGDFFTTFDIFGIGLVSGIIYGIVILYTAGFLVSRVGKFLGGKGDEISIRAAFAWSAVPTISSLILIVIESLLFGEEIFTSEMDNIFSDPVSSIIFFSLLFIELILSLWSLILLIVCISEVQKFSVLKSVGNLILAVLIGLLVFLLLIYIYFFFFPYVRPTYYIP